MTDLLHRITGWRRTRRRAAKRRRALDGADAVVISYGKSGRTWLRAMLSHLYHQRCGVPECELLNGSNFHRWGQATPSVLFTHDGPDEPWNRNRERAIRTIALKKVVFLARDPRDVAVSVYHHTRTRSGVGSRARVRHSRPAPTLLDYVLGAEDGSRGKLRSVVGYMNGWAELLPRLPWVLLVRYEDLLAEPALWLRRVADFVDPIPFTPAEIERAVEFASFANLREKEQQRFFRAFRLRPGNDANPQSFKVRRGKAGGYREDFTVEQVAQLDALVAAELSPLYAYDTPAPAPPARMPMAAGGVRR